jgi:hypothetical protein
MDRNAVFSGNLRFLSIPDLLQLIATNNSTGILGLTNPHALGAASVTFLRGNPIHATYASLRGLEALYALFGWTTGQFEFRQEKIDTEKTIHRGQMEIVLDGLRMLDEGIIKRWDRDRRKGRRPAGTDKFIAASVNQKTDHPLRLFGGRGRIFKRDNHH